jgi:hypothetical protein
MSTSAITGPTLTSNTPNLCSPLSEIDTAGIDRIFLSVPSQGTAAITSGGRTCSGACLYSYDVTSGTLTTGTTAANGLALAAGSSGIVIDNSATSPVGAAQIYFSTLADGACATSGGVGGCAVQASQAGLN